MVLVDDEVLHNSGARFLHHRGTYEPPRSHVAPVWHTLSTVWRAARQHVWLINTC